METDVLLNLSRDLLKAIDTGNWNTYATLCDESISCFEPEALGHLVTGLPFHRFYFDLPPGTGKQQSHISSPNVRIIGDAAIITYVRVVQKFNGEGKTSSTAANETRIWQKKGSSWKHIHFHRSPC